MLRMFSLWTVKSFISWAVFNPSKGVKSPLMIVKSTMYISEFFGFVILIFDVPRAFIVVLEYVRAFPTQT